jgi:hypothetical protein
MDRESSRGNWKKTWSDDDDEPPVAWKNGHNVPLVSKWKDTRNRRFADKSSDSNWEKPQPLGGGSSNRSWDELSSFDRVWRSKQTSVLESSPNKGSFSNWDEPHPLGDRISRMSWDETPRWV